MLVPDSRTVVLDPTREAGWAAAVADHADASIFFTTAWASVLRETYGYTPLYLGGFAGGRLTGGLPVMEVNSWLTGRRGVSLPFSDECDGLADNAEQGRRLLEQAIELGRKRSWQYFESKGGGLFLAEARELAVTFYGHVLDLRKGESELNAALDREVRTAIRKAEKEGVRIETANSLESLRSYYALHCRTRKRHGVPPQPWRFFASIYRHVLSRNMGFVLLARRKEDAANPVAGAVFLHNGRQAIFKFGASDEAYRGLRANNLIMWEAIRQLSAAGLHFLKMGRTSMSNEGLRRFKRGWGTTEYTSWHLKFDYRQNAFVRGRDEAYGWHNAVFRRLPVFVSRCLGGFLCRHWG